MNRRVFLMGAATAAGCARDARPRLNVYNWSSYIDPAMVQRFERDRGVRIRYGTYENNEEMLAKIVSGNSGWDIVFPTHSRLRLMFENGLLAPLDHARLSALKHLESRFRSPEWDPELKLGIPYMWNATGIVYNTSLRQSPAGWDALWSPALSGRITMLDDAEDVLGACLIKLGFRFDSTDSNELNAAKKEAIRQKTLLRAYINAEVRDQLAAGDVLAAQLWSTTAAQAIHSAPATTKLAFVHPREGFPLYCDCAVILRESSRIALAHDFLSFLVEPAVAANNARVAETATAVAVGSLEHDPVLYPPEEVMARGIWPQALRSREQRIRDRLWTEIKTA